MELLDSLTPIFIFSKLSGLSPHYIENNGKRHLKPSNHWKLYSFVVFIFVFVLQIFIFEDRSGTTALTVSLTADQIDTYGFSLTCMISFLVHNSLNEDIFVAINKILDLEKKIKLDQKVLKSNFGLICFDLTASVIYEIIFVYISLYVAPYDYYSFTYYALETVTYVFLELFSFVVSVQFCYFVRILRHMLVVINECILEYIKWAKSEEERVRSENGIRSPETDLFTARKTKKNYDLGEKIALFRTLSVCYSEVSDICTELNQLYAIQNLMSMTLCFIELTYGLYSAIYTNTDAEIGEIFTEIALWSGYFFYKLFLCLHICSTTTREAQKTSEYINQVTELSTNKNLTLELELFSLLLMHREISFHALGFFALDFTLLYSMIGAVTGYLIILLQFQYSASHMMKNCNLTSSVEEEY